ncbi:hypothetical protein AB0E67_16700 [Streptomyces sp. NPDC032161]|uniref:hypothetical protein n=1 Tax=unclassified Streptomyces TaxID=2593676 RepID=UPI0033E7244E
MEIGGGVLVAYLAGEGGKAEVGGDERGLVVDRGCKSLVGVSEEGREASGGDEGMTADRWRFVAKNYTSDATADLRAMRGTPVLLVLDGHDINVDVAETERAYRAILPPDTLEVRNFPDATHSLVRHDIERSDTALTLTALFAPRALFADGVLTGQRRFLERL